MLHCSVFLCFLLWSSTKPELLNVQISAKQLKDSNSLVPRMHWFCCDLYSVLHVFNIFSGVILPWTTRLCTFDEILISAVSIISNAVLFNVQWLQASLPLNDGIWSVIRRVYSLATPAFLASAASTLHPQSRILASSSHSSDSFLQSCISSWSQSVGPLLNLTNRALLCMTGNVSHPSPPPAERPVTMHWVKSSIELSLVCRHSCH